MYSDEHGDAWHSKHVDFVAGNLACGSPDN